MPFRKQGDKEKCTTRKMSPKRLKFPKERKSGF